MPLVLYGVGEQLLVVSQATVSAFEWYSSPCATASDDPTGKRLFEIRSTALAIERSLICEWECLSRTEDEVGGLAVSAIHMVLVTGCRVSEPEYYGDWFGLNLDIAVCGASPK